MYIGSTTCAVTKPPVTIPESPVTPSMHYSSPRGSCSSVTSRITPSRNEIKILDHWRPEIEQCIEQQCLTDSARNEMVRALVHQLFAKARKPSRLQCEDLARKLILKYPFVKDGFRKWVCELPYIHNMYVFARIHPTYTGSPMA